MALFEYDSGDDYHDGGMIADVEDEDLTLEDIEDALDNWNDYDEVLMDIEGDQDYDMQSP